MPGKAFGHGAAEDARATGDNGAFAGYIIEKVSSHGFPSADGYFVVILWLP
jgi:hypothetical protein